MWQGGAKRRRQASRTAYVPEDEDDEFGSQMTDARSSSSRVSIIFGDDGEGDFEEGLGVHEDALSYLLRNDAEDDFAKGFRVSNVASDSLEMDTVDEDALLDGLGMTNKDYAKVREEVRHDLVWCGPSRPLLYCTGIQLFSLATQF